MQGLGAFKQSSRNHHHFSPGSLANQRPWQTAWRNNNATSQPCRLRV